MIDLNRRPRMGLLLISPERFQTIGEGTAGAAIWSASRRKPNGWPRKPPPSRK